MSSDSQPAGHEAAGGRRCQSLPPERLLQRHRVPVPEQVPLRAGDPGRKHFPVFLRDLLNRSDVERVERSGERREGDVSRLISCEWTSLDRKYYNS